MIMFVFFWVNSALCYLTYYFMLAGTVGSPLQAARRPALAALLLTHTSTRRTPARAKNITMKRHRRKALLITRLSTSTLGCPTR